MTEATTAAHEQVPELSVFADAALPNSFFNVLAIANPNEDHIRAFGKLRMILDQRTEPSPINRRKIIDKDATVRISHLQRGDFQSFAADFEWIIDYAIQRPIGLEWNRCGIQTLVGLTQIETRTIHCQIVPASNSA